MKRKTLLLASIFALSLIIQPQVQAQTIEEETLVDDPLEPLNRFFFAINQTIDVIILRPLAVTYRDWMPEFVKDRVGNVLTNLHMPVTILNDALQGDWDGASQHTERFLMNTTIGVAGLFDTTDIKVEREDFGQTLGHWGVESGPYLVLPLLGPSNFRDGFGLIVDKLTDPLSLYAIIEDEPMITVIRSGTEAVHTRAGNIEELDALEQNSIDFYAKIRSVHDQYRKNVIIDSDKNITSAGPEIPVAE